MCRSAFFLHCFWSVQTVTTLASGTNLKALAHTGPPCTSLRGVLIESIFTGMLLQIGTHRKACGWRGVCWEGWGRASLKAAVGALEHQNGVVDLESRAQLDAHDLHNVCLCQQEERLAVDHLMRDAIRQLLQSNIARVPQFKMHGTLFVSVTTSLFLRRYNSTTIRPLC